MVFHVIKIICDGKADELHNQGKVELGKTNNKIYSCPIIILLYIPDPDAKLNLVTIGSKNVLQARFQSLVTGVTTIGGSAGNLVKTGLNVKAVLRSLNTAFCQYLGHVSSDTKGVFT